MDVGSNMAVMQAPERPFLRAPDVCILELGERTQDLFVFNDAAQAAAKKTCLDA